VDKSPKWCQAPCQTLRWFHLVINNVQVSEEEMVRMILSLLGVRKP